MTTLLTLEQRVNDLDIKLMQVQGELMCAHDLIAALMATHPDLAAVYSLLPKDRQTPSNQHGAGYRAFQKQLPHPN